MAKKSNYDTNALYQGLMEQNQKTEDSKSQEVKEMEEPKRKVGRPRGTLETFKRSYYITKQHEKAIKRCSADYECDFSEVVRIAIEELAKNSGNWEK